MHPNSLLCLFALGILLSCNTLPKAQSQPAAPAAPAAFVSWDKKMVELGPVKKGEKRTMFFEFTNPGTENVQIDVVAACDCTTVDYPRGVIAPGQKARLDVIFDSKEKEESETIDIDVIFKNTDAAGNPRIERVSYKYELVK
ncbi:MAG: DUF1573 domain-containing protein [Saprospiraceae bacterium]|nr:DUF1573 domain-containing protein [Saprospiraceae bacterium]